MAERTPVDNNGVEGLVQPGSTARKQLEQSLDRARANLTTWVYELEQRIREIDLLSDMDDCLQTCQTLDEVVAVFTHFMRQLFVAEAGALYLFAPSSSLAKPVATWGSIPLTEWSPLSNKCRVLESRGCQGNGGNSTSPRTLQRNALVPTNYLCIPIPVRGKMMGVFQVRHVPYDGCRGQGEMSEYLSESKQRLAFAVAELVALAFENLQQPEANCNVYRSTPLHQQW